MTLSTAKARRTGLVQAVESGVVVHIPRHGKAVAMVICEPADAAPPQQQAGQRLWAAISDWYDGARPTHADE